MYQLGTTSKERLSTCDRRLQEIIYLAIKRSPIDFGVAEGHRSTTRQKSLYDQGKSKIDGIKRKGKHNFNPSQAVDLYAWVNGKASWDASSLILIAGVVYAAASELGYTIRWGGNWDQDGEIITDQRFQDFPHFEIIE